MRWLKQNKRNNVKVLITGGAGFIGCNLANKFCELGGSVYIFDNLSRKGSEQNLGWLQRKGVNFVKGDVRDYRKLGQFFVSHEDIDIVVHLAAQTAVTTSISNPREDFEINALGTLNILEAIRNSRCDPIFIFSSTNKIYGAMEDVEVMETETGYQFQHLVNGAAENTPLDFYSPYGCSKGTADQYVRDYFRIYGVKTVVLRLSCVYGCRQFGVEDQGWIAWFTIASILGKPLTIYGNGKQVRDILFIDDLVNLIQLVINNISITKGKAYNVGGGKNNRLSLLDLISLLEQELKTRIRVSYSKYRLGDQRIFISDNSRIKRDTGWEPNTSPAEGIRKLIEWVKENKDLISEQLRTC